MKLRFLAFLIPLLASYQGLAAYTLADLEALTGSKSYDEFFAHALDIRPVERTGPWKQLVENMGEGLLSDMIKKPRLERGDFKKMEELTNWAVLANYEFWRIKRQKLGFKWFEQCFKEDSSPSSSCWEDLVSFWGPSRQEPDMAGTLMQLMAPYLATSTPDIKDPAQRYRLIVNERFLLRPVLQSELAELHCKKPDIQIIVWNTLMKEWTQSTVATFPEITRSVAHPSCWQSLLPYAHGLFEKGASSEPLNLAFLLLKNNRALTQVEEDLFYVNYLLDSPANGEIFNLAWTRMQVLGSDSSRREVVMNRLKEWRPLPGHLFGDLDQLKRKTVSRHLQSHFPEFLDYYAKTCVEFYGGKKKFPDGNPALSCHELFNLAASEPGLLPQSTVESFKRSL